VARNKIRIPNTKSAILFGAPVPAHRMAAKVLAALCTASLLTMAGATSSAIAINSSDQLPQSVLFIGDSFTSSQQGLYSHVMKLVQSTPQHFPAKEGHVTVGGATLKHQWELGEAVKAIDSDSYDTVVLQDDIPEINVDYFRQYARMFVEEVRKHGARPILYMTWAYDRLGWISMDQIENAHRELAKELHVEVAPVGLAWKNSRMERPDLDLFSSDREHPSPDGMYLAACVVYATLFKRDPTGLFYAPPEVSSKDATFLQRIAWQTVNSDWMD
jgi:hypothetical protein